MIDPSEVAAEVERRFRPGRAGRTIRYYLTLGPESWHKWTLTVSDVGCAVEAGRVGNADCVIKTTPELFWRIVDDGYTPGPMDLIQGRFKTNDPGLAASLRDIFSG